MYMYIYKIVHFLPPLAIINNMQTDNNKYYPATIL